MTEELMGSEKDSNQTINVVIFVGRLCYAMLSSSCIHGLCYRNETTQGDPVPLKSVFYADM